MSEPRPRLLRISTVPLSLKMFCKDLLNEIKDEYDVLAVSSPGPELDELSSVGIPVEAVPMARNISIKSDIKSLWQLIRTFRRYKPHIVHSLTPKAGLLAMMAARVTGVPVRIHSFTGLIFPTATGLKKVILKTTDRITCACASHILPEGEGVKNDLLKAGITRKPLRVLGHGNLRGIDLEYFDLTDPIKSKAESISKQYGIGEDDFVFVFVGRVVNDKGMTELAEAFSRLTAENHKVHLLIVGPQEPEEDPLSESTQQLLTRTPHVHMTDGWVEDVRPYYAMAHALVFPSYREGFPNVVLEAGAMGLSSIVTDIHGSREIIEEGKNGHIIPVKDANALYTKMKEYATNCHKMRHLNDNCRRIISEKYEAHFVRDCLKDFYRSLNTKKA